MDNGYSIWEFFADCLVTIHLGYMAYVVLGQLAIMIGWALGWSWIRNPWFRLSHMAMILIVALEAVVQFECPLTTWEHQLREKTGKLVARDGKVDVEDASFVAWLVRKIMFPEADIVPYLKPSYYTFALLVLLMFLLAPPRLGRRTPPATAPPHTEAAGSEIMHSPADPTGIKPVK